MSTSTQASAPKTSESGPPGSLLIRPVVGTGLATGAVGLVGGGLYALFKSPQPIAFTAATTLQCAYYGSSIMLARKAALAAVPVEHRDKRAVKTFATGSAGAISGLVASTWQQSTRLRTAVLIGFLGAASQIGYDTLYARYNRPPSKAVPFLERLANSPYMPLKSLPDQEYEDILNTRIEKLEAEIQSVESQLRSLHSQKDQLTNG